VSTIDSSGGPPRRALLRRVGGLVGLAATLGCVPTLPGQGPAPRTFRLTPKSTFPADLPRADWGLAVAEPTAEPSLDTSRIAVLTNGTGVDYIAMATWADRAPTMVEVLLVQSFRESGKIAAVGSNRDRVRADYLLRSDLRAFQLQRNTGTSTVRVRLDPTLLTLPRRELVASGRFSADVAPAAADIDTVVAAFDTALGRVLRDVVVWSLRTGRSPAA
jgi:cholesterol transport system auxiliary component